MYNGKRDVESFYRFYVDNCNGHIIEAIYKSEEGQDTISKIFANYFWSMSVIGGHRPRMGYASKLRSHIKMQIMEDYKFDITDPIKFPKADKHWNSFIEKLSFTKHLFICIL